MIFFLTAHKVLATIWKGIEMLYCLRDILLDRLIRDKHLPQAKACFRFLSTNVQLDLMGSSQDDIFLTAHKILATIRKGIEIKQ